MSLRNQILSVFLILGAPLAAHASEGSVGNGGNAVVCKDASNKIASVELLDYYEARTELGFAIDLGDASLTPAAKAGIALGRLKATAPNTVRWLSYLAQTFLTSAVDFIPNASLTPVQDSNQIAVPSGCEIVQLAIQKQVSLPNQKTYTVNKDLWDLLDNTNKAGLVLHEILYTEALQAGAKDSVGVRYFNGLISSHQIEKTELFDLLQVERQVPLQYFEYQGHNFKIDAQYPYFDAHSGAFRGGPITFSAGVKIDGQDHSVSSITYDEWGTYPETVVLRNPENFDFHGFPIQFTGELMLDKDGKIRRGRVSPDSYFDFESSNYSLKPSRIATFAGKTYPSFVAEDEKGQITECGLCSGWVKIAGQQIDVERSPDDTKEAFNFFDPKTFAYDGERTLNAFKEVTFTVLGNPITLLGQMTFNDDGQGNFSIESGNLTQVGNFHGGKQTMSLQGAFELYYNGNVMTGILAADTQLTDRSGNTETYPRGTKVKFDEKGLLEDAEQ